MRVQIVSLFPEMVQTVADYGVVGRAVSRGLLTVACRNPREFTTDVHRTVDDRPYGGGPGMIMKFEPLAAAIDAALEEAPPGSPGVCLSPQGRVFDHGMAARYAALDGLVLVAGRYEGIDERLIESRVDEEVSLGDFVLSGGEIAAMAVVDAVARLIPGTLGDEESAAQDSFVEGLLDHPQYTRPESIDGRPVPDVLLSGDHARIAEWRRKQALGRTMERRPDLLKERTLTEDDQRLLDEYVADGGDG